MTFQKGQSGNPGGRPKGDVTLTGALRRALRQKGDDGKTHLESVVLQVLEMAKSGNMDAIKLAFDRIDGKVIERIEQSGPDGGPVVLEVTRVVGRPD